MAETRKDAEAAFDVFVETYGVKYEKAPNAEEDRGPLLARTSRPNIGNTCARRMRSTSSFCASVLFMGARATSWRSAACRLQAPPGVLFVPCRIEALAHLAFRRAWTPGSTKCW